MNSIKAMIWAVSLAILLNNVGCKRQGGETGDGKSAAVSSERCPHHIKKDKCPFCKPELIASEGMCGEHAVAEALCYLCRPYLKEAFRAKGDWCALHGAPDSQCAQCRPELLETRRPGEHGVKAVSADPMGGSQADASGACPHGIDAAKCPFCTPSLIQTMGFCSGHNVAEALCVRCRPYLETAFKAKGDWCAEHAVPESQCSVCHPELAKPGLTER